MAGRPVLVLLNGLPASGKSTLARAWAERHADGLPLALDVDVLRGMLGGWRAAPLEAGLAARAVAIAAIGAHLAAGRDVVVPQHLRRPDFAEQLREAAAVAGAGFVECLLVVDPAVAERRAAGRSEGAEGPLERSMAELAAEFAAFTAGRSGLAVLEGEPLDALDALVAAAR